MCVKQKSSEVAYIYGQFDFLATPLAPPGTKVVVHIDSKVRGTWELNGDIGWYVGPAMDHYRCVTCYFSRTRTTRICETVTFFPHNVPFPKVTTTDYLKQAADDIVTILTSPPSTTAPSLQAGDPVRNALLELATQLQRIEPFPMDDKKDTALTRVPPQKAIQHKTLVPTSDMRRQETQPTSLAPHLLLEG